MSDDTSKIKREARDMLERVLFPNELGDELAKLAARAYALADGKDRAPGARFPPTCPKCGMKFVSVEHFEYETDRIGIFGRSQRGSVLDVVELRECMNEAPHGSGPPKVPVARCRARFTRSIEGINVL